jgi:GT2 family glycosyltransferase
VIAIATHNRRDAVRRAITSALEQRPQVDVIVLDDGSVDGTSAMIRDGFPSVRLITWDQPSGGCKAKKHLVEIATAPIVFILDDDAYFTSPDSVAQTVRDFDHPRVAAVAVPFLENGNLRQGRPGATSIEVTSYFIGAAHALRREAALKVGGYRPDLSIYGEEQDLCIRLLATGCVTRVGRADPLVHCPDPRRNYQEIFAANFSNIYLFRWRYTPLLYLPASILKGVYFACSHAARTGLWRGFFRGLALGFGKIMHNFRDRRVDSRAFAVWRRLQSQNVLPLEEIEATLPNPD